GVLIEFGLGAVGLGLLLIGLIPPLWQVLPWTRAAGAEDVPTLLGSLPLPLINANINLVMGLHEPDTQSLITAIMAVTLVAGTGASPTTSGSDDRLEHTTGVPQASASSGGRPNPSYRDG